MGAIANSYFWNLGTYAKSPNLSNRKYLRVCIDKTLGWRISNQEYPTAGA
jgi:hypothetical protein